MRDLARAFRKPGRANATLEAPARRWPVASLNNPLLEGFGRTRRASAWIDSLPCPCLRAPALSRFNSPLPNSFTRRSRLGGWYRPYRTGLDLSLNWTISPAARLGTIEMRPMVNCNDYEPNYSEPGSITPCPRLFTLVYQEVRRLTLAAHVALGCRRELLRISASTTASRDLP